MPDPPIISRSEIRADVNHIDLFWIVRDDGGTPIHSVTIEYKNATSQNDWTKIQISNPIYQYTIPNLSPATMYDFKVLTTNEIGDSKYSETVTIKTQNLGVSYFIQIYFIYYYYAKCHFSKLIWIWDDTQNKMLLGNRTPL